LSSTRTNGQHSLQADAVEQTIESELDSGRVRDEREAVPCIPRRALLEVSNAGGGEQEGTHRASHAETPAPAPAAEVPEADVPEEMRAQVEREIAEWLRRVHRTPEYDQWLDGAVDFDTLCDEYDWLAGKIIAGAYRKVRRG
jgi:hypothetical protein